MKNLFTRSLSGLIYAGLIIGSLIAGEIWFSALAALFAVLAVREFHSLTEPHEQRRGPISQVVIALDIVTAVALVMMSILNPVTYAAVTMCIISVYLPLRVILAINDRRSNAVKDIYHSAMALLYIAAPLTILAVTNSLYSATGPKFGIVMMMFVMIWLNDTGAYCVGCTLGKHRLCERLSPKKSWEGFWGGMAFSVAAGAAYALTIDTQRSVVFWIGMGIVVSLFATWGDLFESLIKRTLGVKDSGKIMPGHGGILDRIDSLLLVAPATLVYITIYEMAAFVFQLPKSC